MKNYFLLCLLFWLPDLLFAQQLPLFTQYRDQWSFINPATINADYFFYDTRKKGTIGLSYRRQWLHLNDGPHTQHFRGEYILSNQRTSLVTGGYVLNDQTGPTGFTGLYGRVAGIIKVRPDPYYGFFSIGFNIGAVQYRNNTIGAITTDGIGQDLAINECNCKQIFPDVGIGLFYQTLINRKDNVYIGLSVPQIFSLDVKFNTDTGQPIQQRRIQHFYLVAGVYKSVSDLIAVEPSIWLRYVENAPLSIDTNVRVKLAVDEEGTHNLVLGGGYSLNKTMHLEFSWLIWGDSVLKFGFAYDHSWNVRYNKDFGSSFEFNLAYSFGK